MVSSHLGNTDAQFNLVPCRWEIVGKTTEESGFLVTTSMTNAMISQVLEPDEEGVERLEGHMAFVGVSPAMREVRHRVGQVAKADASVLLLGESGTGKEVVARLIHKLSKRNSQKFLKVNCAALPADLLESELFGYEAGAFTSAHHAKAGKFEICHKGTILLDEIAEMPIPPQAKLLHVLQDGEFSRLGSTSTVQTDVRVLAATNVNVQRALRSGSFRADLYYRLNVFTIHLPPLRERKEDLPHLLRHFMSTWSASYGRPSLAVTPRILVACAKHSWPGNVRELENFVKRYLLLGNEDEALDQLGYEMHSVPGTAGIGLNGTVGADDLKSLVRDLKHETERTVIVEALNRTNGKKQLAAKLLGISLRALQYKVRRYEIEPSQIFGQTHDHHDSGSAEASDPEAQ